MSEHRAPVVIIGVGNELRGDDGAGIEVARRVRQLVDPRQIVVLEQHGEALGLIDQWDGYRAALIVDAIGTGGRAGCLRRLDASSDPLPAEMRSSTSTHAVGVGETIELARAIGRLPETLVVHGVQGEVFDTGSGLSGAVRAAIGPLAAIVCSDAGGLLA